LRADLDDIAHTCASVARFLIVYHEREATDVGELERIGVDLSYQQLLARKRWASKRRKWLVETRSLAHGSKPQALIAVLRKSASEYARPLGIGTSSGDPRADVLGIVASLEHDHAQ
jgi:hypothetical protein